MDPHKRQSGEGRRGAGSTEKTTAPGDGDQDESKNTFERMWMGEEGESVAGAAQEGRGSLGGDPLAFLSEGEGQEFDLFAFIAGTSTNGYILSNHE